MSRLTELLEEARTELQHERKRIEGKIMILDESIRSLEGIIDLHGAMRDAPGSPETHATAPIGVPAPPEPESVRTDDPDAFQWLSEYGVMVWDDERRARLRAMLDQGMDITAIAEATGLRYQQVTNGVNNLKRYERAKATTARADQITARMFAPLPPEDATDAEPTTVEPARITIKPEALAEAEKRRAAAQAAAEMMWGPDAVDDDDLPITLAASASA